MAIVPVPWHEALGGAHGLRSGVVPVRFWYAPGVGRSRLHMWLRMSTGRTFKRAIRDFRPDVVLSYWAHPDGTTAIDLAHDAGLPATLMVGGTDINELSRHPQRRDRIVSTLLAADQVLTIGESLRTATVGLGVPDSKVATFERGVDTGIFHPGDRNEARRTLGVSSSEPMLLWVGRMVPVKGLDVLIAALHSVPAERRPHLHLVGDGPERPRLVGRIRAAGLERWVHLVGPRAPVELPIWYRAADTVVLPSRSEGVPNVLREALSCGTPFVASKVGGIEGLAQEPGWLVEPDDPGALAEAIERILADPPKVRPPEWSSERSAKDLSRVLQGVLARHRGVGSG